MANTELGYPEGLQDQSAAHILAFAEGQSPLEDVTIVEEGADGEGTEPATDAAATPDKPLDEEGASSGAKGAEGEEAQKGTDKETLVPLNAVYAEREKARRAKEHAASLQARLDQLEQSKADGAAVPPTDIELLSDEEIAALEEDFPQIAKTARAVKALTGKLQTMEAEKAAVAKVQQEEAEVDFRTAAQQAVDNIPKLKHLQTSLSPELWQARIVGIDVGFNSDPELSQLPFDQRYAKLMEVYEYRYGPVALPPPVEEPKPAAPAATTPALTSALKQKADEAVRQAGTFRPKTLSDIPGGAPPASESTGENATAFDLVKAFERMTPDQMEAALSRVM